MKPIKLVLKGLNSFEDEQSIDFISLTRNGFFGIFGPTGSGKSTLLDGIMLALYGKESRNSGNFINVNGDRAFVRFEFQISDTPIKRYAVEREFKRNKSGGILSNKCKLMDITYEDVEILEESVTMINKRCEEIIGLNKDDFMRTVVLPQGKFSEFLKMEGKPRCDMLERLFNLQAYGMQLKSKVMSALKQEEMKQAEIVGALNVNGDIDEAIFQQKKEEVKNQAVALEHAEKQVKTLLITFEEQQKLNEMDQEHEKHLKNQEKLQEKASLYAIKRKTLEKLQKAESLKSLLEEHDANAKERDLKSIQVTELKNRKKDADKQFNEAELAYKNAKRQQEEEKPHLLIEMQKLQEALSIIEILKAKEEAIQKQSNEFERLEQEYEQNDLKASKLKASMLTTEQQLKELDEEMLLYKVASDEKALVRKGKALVEKQTITQESKLKLEEKIQKLKAERESHEEMGKGLHEEAESLLKQKKQLQDQQSALKASEPGRPEDVFVLERKLREAKQALDRFDEIEQKYKQTEAYYQKQLVDKKVLDERVQNREEQVTGLKKKIEALKIQHQSTILRQTLKEGEPCPVCGGLDHPKVHARHEEEKDFHWADEENLLIREEKALQSDFKRQTALETELNLIEKQRLELQNELTELNDLNLRDKVSTLSQDFETFKNQVKTYEKESQAIEEALKKSEAACLKHEQKSYQLKTMMESQDQMLKSHHEDLKVLQDSLDQLNDELKTLENIYPIKNWIEESRKIDEKEKKLEISEKKYQSYKNQEKETREVLYTLESTLEQQKSKLQEVKLQLKHLKESEKQIREEWESKVGSLADAKLRYEENKKKVQAMDLAFKTRENHLNESTKLLSEVSSSFGRLEQSLEDLEKRQANLNSRLEEGLKEKAFDSIEQLKDSLSDLPRLKNLENELEVYEKECDRVQLLIDDLARKLKGRTFNREAFERLKEEKEQEQRNLEMLIKNYSREQMALETLEEKMKQAKDLLAEKQKVDRKIAIFRDLDSVLKGNKFVEFVANERLKYITKEASERLLDITNGAYAIQTSEDSDFLIQDNKNGGILRKPSTLSGGETFIVSLALSLALSSEIQLKGTAPLELFFLDEGFGTLDDQLLDVLMNSLERIHHEKLKVGVISHVEMVQNRVPVKLMVKPARSGEGGSQLKIVTQ